ncbi:MAG: hypothetical protein A3E83_02825 [Gammaproteobacteria bacterium RIFCSPHIGHO2_12_FULL_41_20]|nr:MAG: hypothetical protein A3E83_02825 [Gammaproteobacteria bacterium RIFCSPHIGHO2_12_FULL_41_20]
MFLFHIATSLGLIALAAGSALYVFSARCDGKGKCCANVISILVVVLSILSLLCTFYCGIKSWQQGNDQCLLCMKHGMEVQDKSMIDNKDKLSKKVN